jgi:hypothetical protein
MTRTDLNSLNMFKAVELFYLTNNEVLAPFDAIKNAGAQIKLMVAEIDDLSKTQSQNTKVETGLKNIERDELNDILDKVIAALGAEAVATQNNELRLSVNTNKSDIKRLREADYKIRVDWVYATALPQAKKKKKWGVTAAEIEMLNTKAASFAGRSTVMRNKTAVTKQASAEIKEKIAALSTYLRNDADTLMAPFATLNPTLYGQYKNARKIVEKAATQTKKPDAETAL